ncbi:unnamed protein product [Clonostachys rosea f. rosea IK726]|uniref:Uncharacterized protein n=1 Tax=Clonostachys rosea f. rosea IK726 TaxID=1349383 RepID=A0ACA9UEL2_BIOOC|nr:unnamed protein product [Clonostachys rosea f. rosea IK726]
MDMPKEYEALEKEDHEHDEQHQSHLYDGKNLASRHEDNIVPKQLYKTDNWLKGYLVVLCLYLAGAIFCMVWSYTGAIIDTDASKRRVFRTSDNLPVDQLYSGIALSALLAPAGILVQWLVYDIRRFHLFALAAQKPIRIADLDDITESLTIWTLRTVVKYSWWYGLMHFILILIRTLLVPVGTLTLTVGPYTHLESGTGVIGLPISRADAAYRNITALSTAMGGTEETSFRPSLDKNDTFLAQAVYTFVGNLVSQSALVNVDSGTLGPVPTHNLTFKYNTTYDGLVFFRWDAHCTAATEVSYTSHQQEDTTTYNFTLPDGHVESIELLLQSSQRLRLWSNVTERDADTIPTGGTTYFLSATRSIPTTNETALLMKGADKSLVQTDDGHWISRTKCTPSFDWTIGSCWFNGTTMTSCQPSPGANTSALDTDALDALSMYMTVIPWYIFDKKIAIVDYTLDALYSIPTAEDFSHFFGNMAHAIVSVSTAGYFGTSTVPTKSLVTELVYIVRTSVLIAVMLMFALTLLVSAIDMIWSKLRRLPYLTAGFMAIAHAVRGPWWENELEGHNAWEYGHSRPPHPSTVMFGFDNSDPKYIRLAPSVEPIHR